MGLAEDRDLALRLNERKVGSTAPKLGKLPSTKTLAPKVPAPRRPSIQADDEPSFKPPSGPVAQELEEQGLISFALSPSEIIANAIENKLRSTTDRVGSPDVTPLVSFTGAPGAEAPRTFVTPTPFFTSDVNTGRERTADFRIEPATSPPVFPVSPTQAESQRLTGLSNLPQQQQRVIAGQAQPAPPGTGLPHPGLFSQPTSITDIPLSPAQLADAARYTAQALFGGFDVRSMGYFEGAFDFQGNLVNPELLPNMMTPELAFTMGLTEEQRIMLGYNPDWPYELQEPGGFIPGAGDGGGGGSGGFGGFFPRTGSGSTGLSTRRGLGLVNWRIGF